MTSRAICNYTRGLEIVVILFTVWAGLVTFNTPFLLQTNPPYIYRELMHKIPEWEWGLMIFVMVLLHAFALVTAPDCTCRRGEGSMKKEPLKVQIGMVTRVFCSVFHVVIWAFFSASYIMLWTVKGQSTIASGMCVVVLGCSSVVSYCVSGDRARRNQRDMTRL